MIVSLIRTDFFVFDLRELADLVCQTPCCSSPSNSWPHRWPQAQAFHPPCPSRLCRPVAPSNDPAGEKKKKTATVSEPEFILCIYSNINFTLL